jgi:hypothetical protein
MIRYAVFGFHASDSEVTDLIALGPRPENSFAQREFAVR